MDLVATLRSKIDTLEEGEHTPGLRAVLLHIETAFRHLSRGQETDEETAFTDAIYRTNQAFEGSIKEAYRVLAGKDPAKMRPFDIENYLEEDNIFRSRVLAQFTNYRTEWRNPSTHDYKLDFDESEAFLAIISVSAFACLLFDQIAERLSFLKSKREAEAEKGELRRRLSHERGDLLAETTEILREFCRHHSIGRAVPRQTEVQVVGALAGFFATATPELRVSSEGHLAPDRPYHADLIVSDSRGRVIIELKRTMSMNKIFHNAIAQVEHYMLVGDTKAAVLLFLPEEPGELDVIEHAVRGIEGRLIVLRPKAEGHSVRLA